MVENLSSFSVFYTWGTCSKIGAVGVNLANNNRHCPSYNYGYSPVADLDLEQQFFERVINRKR